MKKIVFLEGLPGVGKTTIISKLKTLNKINVVDEVINNKPEDNRAIYYIKNDEKKISMYDEGLIVIDRGLLSTISYEQAKKIINNDYNNETTLKWFDEKKYIYQNNDVMVMYLKRDNNEYKLPYIDEKDPYGSIENQKLLESITLYNLKKYSNNYKIINYNHEKMEEMINEIID